VAARRPILGRDHVVAFLVGLHRAAQRSELLPEMSLQVAAVNLEPALILRVGGRLESVFVFTIEDAAVTTIRVVRNPDKLVYIDRQLSRMH
jgi:RNA polymerase sigma-70 factor (ECF subfamily)